VYGSLKNTEGRSVMRIMCKVKIEGRLISCFSKININDLCICNGRYLNEGA